MTSSESPAAPTSLNKALAFPLEPFIYGLATLASVWALGGGNPEILWARALALGLVLAVLGLGSLIVGGQWSSFKSERLRWKVSLASAVATALPFVFVAYILQRTDFLPYKVPAPTGLLTLVAFAFLTSFGSEVIYRKFLYPAWGLSTAAFVEALTLGFGSHFFFFFLSYFIMGHAWALLLSRYNLKTVILSRVLWTLIVFGATYLFA